MTTVGPRGHLGDVTVAAPGVGLRAIGAASRIYAKLVAESTAVTALSPPRPRRSVGYEFEATIDDFADEAVDVRSFLLRRTDGRRLPSWLPGAHIDVTTPSGALRQYSLAGRPDGGNHYRIGVRKIPGGSASGELHRLERGDILRLRGPRNAFPMAEAQHYFFVAAGIGITPIRAMIERAAADGIGWTLYYHGRSRETLPFLADLGRLATESGGRIFVRTDDIDGVPDVAEILGYAASNSAMYVCGPAGLSTALREEVRRRRSIREFHSELFAPAPVVDGVPFLLRMQRSGDTIEVGAQETALAAVRRVRPDQPYSCRQGFCGACVVGLLDGSVDHRDRVLGAEDRNSSLALCVSRGSVAGDVIVLDL